MAFVTEGYLQLLTHALTRTHLLLHEIPPERQTEQLFQKPLKHKTLFTQFQSHTVFQPTSDTKCKLMHTLNRVPTTSKLVKIPNMSL